MKGEDVLIRARAHLGQAYALGAVAELDNPDYAGPWDCADFVTWCVWQAYGVLCGVTSAGHPFSGAWITYAEQAEQAFTPDDALHRPGAILIRRPGAGLSGHVAFSDGCGGTVEARGRRYGVTQAPARGRVWHLACGVPGVRYDRTGRGVED